MGYYTDFRIKVSDKDRQTFEITTIAGNEYPWNNIGHDSMKWYNHTDDMITLSACHPELFFQLSGDGEDYGDIWSKLYHNGSVVKSWEPQTLYPDLIAEFLGGTQ